jgi:hypothetical protein
VAWSFCPWIGVNMCSDLTSVATSAIKTSRGARGAYLPLRPPGPMDVFWSELSTKEHVLQVYEKEQTHLDAMEGFVSAGLRDGDGVIVIATPEHLAALEKRLERHPPHGFNLESLKRQDRYIAMEAAETLGRFRDADGWPDPGLFEPLIKSLLQRAGAEKNGERTRSVRAYGEMVALMWVQEQRDATVRLEQMWHEISDSQDFALFCAYPKIGFTQDAVSWIRDICSNHTKVIPG